MEKRNGVQDGIIFKTRKRYGFAKTKKFPKSTSKTNEMSQMWPPDSAPLFSMSFGIDKILDKFGG